VDISKMEILEKIFHKSINEKILFGTDWPLFNIVSTLKNQVNLIHKLHDKVKTKYPEAKLVLLGMQVPPNLGKDYTNRFKEIYPGLAVKNNMALVPFLLEGVGGVASLNQADGIHPTAAGDKIVAENVWKVLKDVLEK